MNPTIKAATALLENQFVTKSIGVKPVTESQEVIEEEADYIPEAGDFVLDGSLFEADAHVGEHVGFAYRSAHPKGRIRRIVRNLAGKIVKVFIRPDKEDRHTGEPAEVSRRAGKFHALAEAKYNKEDAKHMKDSYFYHINAGNAKMDGSDDGDPDMSAEEHYKVAEHHAKRYHQITGQPLYDPDNMQPTEHITADDSFAHQD